MRIRPALIALALAGGIASAPLSAAAQAELPDAALGARIDSIANAALATTGAPSASVAVVRHGRVVYSNAYGSAKLQPDVAAKPDMAYGIGSISKQFAAASVLMLQQEGKLSLNDPVSRFFPELTRSKEITIRELLSHTSGYQDYWPQDYVPLFMQKPITAQGILDHWAKQPLDFEPGTKWEYSNTNYVIASMIVAKVSGEPFFTFIQKRILDPLGMKSAIDYDVLGPSSIQPVGYMRYALGPLVPATPTGTGWIHGAGELAMTASDLAKWDIAMIHESLLARTSYKALETTMLLRNGVSTGYGLGVDVGTMNGHRMISHNGEVAGFTAGNFVFPDDSVAVVVLTNQDAAPAYDVISSQIIRALFMTQGAEVKSHTDLARGIFAGLQKGNIDRSLFTADANAYFSDSALKDFASSLDSLGAPVGFVQISQSDRGGMVERSYLVTFRGGHTVRAWTYELPDGKLEQYQVSPIG
ncbi:MAG: serine hydrolase domain-containing protein [Gemmatimonadaceae bacterium]